MKLRMSQRLLKNLLVFYHVLIYHYEKFCWAFNSKTHPKRITRRLSVWIGRSERHSVVGMSFLGRTSRLPERTRTIRGSINFLVYLHFGKLLFLMVYLHSALDDSKSHWRKVPLCSSFAIGGCIHGKMITSKGYPEFV